jgi:phytoene synthase
VNPESAAHALARLRELDRDRYFATLVLPAAARPPIAALYAFGAEMAAIRERVHEPTAGEIRLQWWKDALKGQGHGEVRQNPLADALLDAVAEYHLPTPPLLRCAEARRFDLYQDKMPDLETFEGYAGETVSVLHQLAAVILNAGQPVETGDAAGHLGVAQALVGHLRAFGYNATRGRIFLPWSILAANGVREEEVFAGEVSEGLLAAHQQFVDLAHEHLGKARAAIAVLPKHLRPGFAAVALVGPQLRRTEMAAEQAFIVPPDLADWQKLVRLCWTRWGPLPR